MKTFCRIFVSLMIMIVSVLSLLACAFPFGLSGEAIEGKVLEAGTNKPIPHAIVVVRWDGILAGFAEQRGVCVHVESTTTDEQGRYRINAWRKPSTMGGVRDVGPTISAYQPSYEIARRDREKNTVYLRPFTGGRGERLRAVWSSGVQCGSAGDSEKNLIPLYRALYEEAKPLAQTDEDRKVVNALLYEMEKRELGYDAATKRMFERK